MLDVADLFWQAAEPLSPQSILDVGTGLAGVVGMHHWDRLPGKKMAIDIHAIRDLPRSWKTKIMDARQILDLGERSFDVVQSCDFIEHLTKEDGLQWLRDAERVAAKAVLLFTPIGLVPSPAADLEPDNPHQRHLSGWSYDDLEALGYQTGRDVADNMWRSTAIVAWKVLSR